MLLRNTIFMLVFLMVFQTILFSKEKSVSSNVKNSIEVLKQNQPYYYEMIYGKKVIDTLIYFNAMNFVNSHDNLVFNFEINRIKLLFVIKDWLGTRYVYAGKSKNGVDCSGFTTSAINETLNQKVLRGSSRTLSGKYEKIRKLSELQFGDLIFFASSKNSKRIGHVGIYLGNNIFVHSSSRKGVIISEIDSHYKARFRFGSRIKFNEIINVGV